MQLAKWNDAEPLPTPFDAHKIISTPLADLVHLTLEPGQAIAPHGNDLDVIFYVIAGEGTLTVDEKTADLTRGDSVFIPKDASRGWTPAACGLPLLGIKFR